MSRKYLLRFDDICPTLNWRVWSQVEEALDAAGVKPIVAVVPDNKDPLLSVDAADPGFWDRVRRWQRSGWAIGLHGFQHRYVTASAGLLGRNPYSEFAGLPEREQESKLTRALAVFEAEGVAADAWVAPAHSFDAVTLRVLERLGVSCVSDGYARYPHRGAGGLFWVPQQLGRMRWMPSGVWTVCLHINAWREADVTAFRANLDRFRRDFTDLSAVHQDHKNRPRTWEDRVVFRAIRLGRNIKKFNIGGSGARSLLDNAQ